MPVLLLPDLFAISLLTVVLALIHRKFRHEAGALWTMGLLLIVVECAAHLIFVMKLPPFWHRFTHVIALNAYLLAGFVFLQSANPAARKIPYQLLYRTCGMLPLLMLSTLYGIDNRVRLLYLAIAIFGLVSGISMALFLHQNRRHIFVFCILWSPVILASVLSNFRFATYTSLAMLYALIAVCFLHHLPRESKGRLLIAAGFFAWAFCFAIHPWADTWGKTYLQLETEVWDMQKFLITIGFVLQMFERQVWQNEWMALHDDLTGLPNRRLYEERLSQAVHRADRNGTSIILFNMDLDGFKQVNDTLGHGTGDVLLREIGLFLQRVVRKTDTLARVGGDEFTLLAVDVASPQVTSSMAPPAPRSGPFRMRKEGNSNRGAAWPGRQGFRILRSEASLSDDHAAPIASLQNQANRIASDLRSAIEQPITVPLDAGEKQLRMRTSIGFAIYPEDTRNVAELCRLADRRMYDEKQLRAQGLSEEMSATELSYRVM